jgi:hypothetical protein
MPSLHVGWALIVAIGLIRATRTRWRWLWTLYPVATFLVVVGTANHYWLDGLVAIAIVAVIAPIPGLLRARTPSAAGAAVRVPALTRSVPAVTRSVIAAFAALPPSQVAAMAASVPRQREGDSQSGGGLSAQRLDPEETEEPAETAMSRVWI